MKVLKNHTAHACDGEQLAVTCPYKTSVNIISAFYGRRVPSENLCPSSTNTSGERTDCMSQTAIQKALDECQNQRSCGFPVNSRVFGQDPCPGTKKYLIVSYKCKPDNHKSKTVCENEKLRLQCKNKTILTIYSATYGRSLQGNSECPSENGSGPDIECLSSAALWKVSRRCHSKENCSIFADNANFGDPCFPGVRKQLKVSYTCVPRQLFEEVSRGSPDPFSLSDYTHGLPEKVGLYFVCGVCGGLVFLLFVFGSKVTILQDIRKVCLEPEMGGDSAEQRGAKTQEDIDEDDDDDDDTSSDSSFRRLTQSYRTSENIFSPEVAAEIAEKAEQREQESREIWVDKESSPYAIHKIKSATK
ncbi:protein eva-1 homolog C [Latimeria chalumnae]|uniref:protein eva-1 homolog C n=1 Tax=Latimeria chalumnae TaxID=7897 RepID=UPI0006D8F767|nr:PREDICTED: protein eva-1 homolog C-like [Latimeria chalumnae]|eukprot:XP_014343119.1 PREDICTED: protein eva-1 homolog C-like [Latimeria chalumnae]